MDTNTQKKMKRTRQLALITGAAGLILLLFGLTGDISYKPGILILLVAFLPVGVMTHERSKEYAFTAWVLFLSSTAFLYPQPFTEISGFQMSLLIVPLVQIIMFGMGTTLSIADFTRVAKSPWPVFVGIFLQFGVMPFSGYLLAESFGFDGELAAGIVLIGSCSGGVASNLMAYLARGNVALSVSMTFCSTLAAPLATPFLMSALAGTYVPIDPVSMMYSILNMIIVPVVAGIVANKILYSESEWAGNATVLILIGLIGFAVSAVTLFLGTAVMGSMFSGILLGGLLIGLVTFAKYVMNNILNRPNTWMDKVLPFTAMAAICLVLAIIFGQSRDSLLVVGFALFAAAIIHNGLGYIFGYWGSKYVGIFLGRVGYKLGITTTSEPQINESECRTIAFEVGMQNGGMAVGLATDVLQSVTAALPGSIFGAWMNISGSILANFWKARPTDEDGGKIETTGGKMNAAGGVPDAVGERG